LSDVPGQFAFMDVRAESLYRRLRSERSFFSTAATTTRYGLGGEVLGSIDVLCETLRKSFSGSL
jgi:hypothetical protein